MPASNSDARKRHEELTRAQLVEMPREEFDALRPDCFAPKLTDLNYLGQLAEAAKVGSLTGLSGWAQSGKDSTGIVMVKEFGRTKVSFADPLRAIARQSNPIVEVRTNAPFPGWSNGLQWEHGLPAEWFYERDPAGAYEWLKANTSYRQFLIDLGKAVRQHLGEDTFVNAALDNLAPGGDYVVTDVRYRNEADAIRARGGEVWRVVRVGHQSVSDDISEHDLDDYDFDRVLVFEDYADDLDRLYRSIEARLLGAVR